MCAAQKHPINLTTVHGRRLAEKIELRQSGRTPTRLSYAWRVECLAIPGHIRERALKGFSAAPGYIWLRRPHARDLCIWAKQHMVPAERIRVEFLRCRRCKRVLLGLEAASHRALLEQSYTPDEVPCSPGCRQKRKH